MRVTPGMTPPGCATARRGNVDSEGFIDEADLDFGACGRVDEDLGGGGGVDVTGGIFEPRALEPLQKRWQAGGLEGHVIEVTLSPAVDKALALGEMDDRLISGIQPVALAGECGPRAFGQTEDVAKKILFIGQQLGRRPDVDVV